MNLPTKITVFRLLLIPVFVAVYYLAGSLATVLSALIFILASFTDFLDGYLARKRNEITNLGAFLDPVADKVLVIAALILLTAEGVIPTWSVLLIISRETLINGFRLIAVEQGIVISASYLGKLKTVTQLFSLILLLFAPLHPWLLAAGLILYWLAVAATVISGIEYIYLGRELLRDKR